MENDLDPVAAVVSEASACGQQSHACGTHALDVLNDEIPVGIQEIVRHNRRQGGALQL